MHVLPPGQASVPLLPRPHPTANVQSVLSKLFPYLLAEGLEDLLRIVLFFDLGYSTNFDAHRFKVPYVER